MVICSVADVRVHADPEQISDADITSIIAGVSTEILTRAGSTDDTNAYLKLAAIHAAAAITLKRARAAGELTSNKTPEYEVSFTGIIEEIKNHEEQRENFLSLYKASVPDYSFTSPSFNAGFTHHHHGGHHH
jgi:hypothetical protein